jgi:uncharacterized protein YqjF (DUF2071 family)
VSFLTAEWRRLAIANYAVDPALLLPYLPYKTELDLWNNTCYVSLVGFLFKNTRVRGVRIPYHTDFEEMNLRFYVRYTDGKIWKRGVVFIKEIVPRRAITFVANTFYKEHYETKKMSHLWMLQSNGLRTAYSLRHRGEWHSIDLISEKNSEQITENSETEFITEHYWGYSKVNDTKTVEYEVTHPKWEVYPVKNYNINFNFEAVYGKDFELLTTLKPTSVMLAEGSAITVENKKIIH